MERHKQMLSMSIAFAVFSAVGLCQSTGSAQRDITLDAKMRTEVIDGTLKAINERYAYPDRAKAIEIAVRARVARKEYEDITSGATLAEVLTAHLREVVDDPHLRVEFVPDPTAPSSPTAQTAETPAEKEAARQHWLRYGVARNFFIDRAERLPGNVGYLKLSAFFFVDMTRDTLASAFTFIAHTNALILDLRTSRGGDVATTETVSDYFKAEPKNKNVTAPRYTGRPVYVLTSKAIYSAPEGLAREFQRLKIATIVGEVTRGATNITAGVTLNRHFSVSVPYTKSDVSRTGVVPDVEVPAERAFAKAYLLALEGLPDSGADEKLRSEIVDALQKVKAELQPGAR
jgi:hypothetical protein